MFRVFDPSIMPDAQEFNYSRLQPTVPSVYGSTAHSSFATCIPKVLDSDPVFRSPLFESKAGTHNFWKPPKFTQFVDPLCALAVPRP